MSASIDIVRDLILELLPEFSPRSGGGLTLVPLYGQAPTPPHTVATEAFERQWLSITEIDEAGDVNHLLAHNRGEIPVLLIDGEHLVGAKQNRVLNSTVLLGIGKTTLPVSCVEEGRWRYTQERSFEPAPEVAHTRLRSMNKRAVVRSARTTGRRDADQGAVWHEVASLHEEMRTESPTGSMHDSFVSRESEVAELRGGFAEPFENATGVLALIDGRVVACDVFSSHDTLKTMWSPLVNGYAMDAVGHKPHEADEQTVKTFLAGAVSADMESHAGVGLGEDVTIAGTSVVGNALTWEGGVAHLALFPQGEEGHRTRMSSPRRRRRGSANPGIVH